MNDNFLLEEILELATTLVRIPSVTVGGPVRFQALFEVRDLIETYLREAGLEIFAFDQGKYPALLAAFPGQARAQVMISGHFDVVAPEPDDSQFQPHIEGPYFYGRGCADMKTMLATLMVWMSRRMEHGPPFPPINLLLIGNEEQGEGEPMGTPHILQAIKADPAWGGYEPRLFIAAERTGERGHEVWGQIQPENRGAVRFKLVATGRRIHSSMAGGPDDLVHRLSSVSREVLRIAQKYLTLDSDDGWFTLLRFPFFLVGEEGVYNITADEGILGVEIRPIPQDDVDTFMDEVEAYCADSGFELQDLLLHPGVSCDMENPYLQALISAVREASGGEPAIGRKLASTSARFAPNGQGVVWGQTGVNPHSDDEKHFIPSILPYYRALKEFEVTAAEAANREPGDG